MSELTNQILTAMGVLIRPGSSNYYIEMQIGGKVYYYRSNSKWDPDINNALAVASEDAGRIILKAYLQTLMQDPSQPIFFEGDLPDE